MAPPTSPRAPRPLDPEQLQELAFRYVGRYATTRAKLHAYLSGKLRQRGWSGAGEPDLDHLAQRLSELGYINDKAYALAKSESLSRRGYGKRILEDRLRLAGVNEDEREEALENAQGRAVEAALRFARRRGIGPFATGIPGPRQRERSIAAMIRAGHSLALAKAIALLPPGAEVDEHELRRQSQ